MGSKESYPHQCVCFKKKTQVECQDCKIVHCDKCFTERETGILHFHSQLVDRGQKSIIFATLESLNVGKPLCSIVCKYLVDRVQFMMDIENMSKKILMDKFHMKADVFVDFLVKYPGICTDYNDDVNRKNVGCGQPSRYMAPCFTKKFEIFNHTRSKNEQEAPVFMSTNFDSHVYEKLTMFGTYKRRYIACPDGMDGCEVSHSRIETSYKKEHTQLREQYNAISLKYRDIHALWQVFIDEKSKNYIDNKFTKFFACKLKSAFIEKIEADDHYIPTMTPLVKFDDFQEYVPIEKNLLELAIEKEIDKIITKSRYSEGFYH